MFYLVAIENRDKAPCSAFLSQNGEAPPDAWVIDDLESGLLGGGFLLFELAGGYVSSRFDKKESSPGSKHGTDLSHEEWHIGHLVYHIEGHGEIDLAVKIVHVEVIALTNPQLDTVRQTEVA